MNVTSLGFEPGTVAWILVVVGTTLVMLTFIVAVARRWQSDWWVSLAFIIAGCSSLALGSWSAVRVFMNALDSMSRIGGGIASVWFGIWQATQPVLTAAWLAMVIAFLAGVFVLPRAWKELRSLATAPRPRAAMFAGLGAFALVIGVLPVLLFQRAIAFVWWAVTPRAHPGNFKVSEAVATRLFTTSIVSACCFLIVIALLVMILLLARRSGPSRPLFVITVLALVATLGVSAALVVNLRSFSNRSRTAALTGRLPSQ